MEKTKRLHVLLNEKHIGLLTEEKDGKHAFQYDMNADSLHESYISLSIPRRSEVWRGTEVEAFIDGILPDDRNIRESIAKRFDVNARNPFSLLTAIGLDCAGALQFLSDEQYVEYQEEKKSDLERGAYLEITEKAIGHRLGNLTRGHRSAWQQENEHWSLNGAQEKIALAYSPLRKQWYEATGTAATTHILKPGISDLKEQAFNEYLCLKALAAMGMEVEHVDFHMFDGEPAIVAERWDREVSDDDRGFSVKLIHQEDMCQALSVYTENKYQQDGGPSAKQIIEFMESRNFERISIPNFYEALVANFFLGGTDAHAKNYAIVEQAGRQPRLAPLYDIASIYPYVKDWHKVKMAMSIDRQYKLNLINLRRWLAFANECGGSEHAQIIIDLLIKYLNAFPDVFDAVGESILSDMQELDADSIEDKARVVQSISAGIRMQSKRIHEDFISLAKL